MNRVTEMRTGLLSLADDEQARVLQHLVGHFGVLAETRPHHPAVSAFVQALETGVLRARMQADIEAICDRLETPIAEILAEAIDGPRPALMDAPPFVCDDDCPACGNRGGDDISPLGTCAGCGRNGADLRKERAS